MEFLINMALDLKSLLTTRYYMKQLPSRRLYFMHLHIVLFPKNTDLSWNDYWNDYD